MCQTVKYWTTIQSDNTARIPKKGGTYTLKLKGDKDMRFKHYNRLL